MTVAHLTQEATLGKMPQPITVNAAHVTKLEPRARPIPNQGSQHGGLIPQYQGSVVHLVTGDRVLVLEDYDVVDARLWPTEAPVKSARLSVDIPSAQSIPQTNISGLTEELKGAPEHVVDEPAPPAKKAPSKKAGPKAEDKADESPSEEMDED